MHCVINDTSFTNPTYDYISSGPDSIYYLAGDTGTSPSVYTYELTDSLNKILESGKQRLYVWGTIAFKDMAEKERRSYFFMMYDVAFKKFVGVSPQAKTGIYDR